VTIGWFGGVRSRPNEWSVEYMEIYQGKEGAEVGNSAPLVCCFSSCGTCYPGALAQSRFAYWDPKSRF